MDDRRCPWSRDLKKLEGSTKNVTIETILKVFKALKAKVKFSVEMNELEFKVA
jgi:HTH-type transcriptional regulator / antitoxin HipB